VRFVCEDESELEKCQSKATKLRIILLERQERNMFCKLSSFNTRDKSKFTKEINKMWTEMTDEEIDLEFNSVKRYHDFMAVSNIESKRISDMCNIDVVREMFK
jgi:hypothetical protein